MPALKGPLDGIRVVDMSSVFPAPLAAMYLGDMGADVVKVEHPRNRDVGRLMGGRIQLKDGAAGDSGVYFNANRNKRGVAINWTKPAGREVLMKLLEQADILIESARPGTLAQRELGFEHLREKFPRLIYCHLSGYGYDGPYSDHMGHDATFIAYAGLLGLSGPANGAPVLPGFQAGDIAGGTQVALISILAALQARHATGRGQFLDIGMLDGAFSLLALVHGESLGGADVGRGRGALSGGIPNYNVYRCSDDKYIMFAPLEEHFFKAFLERIGKPGWLERAKINPLSVRRSLSRLFATRTRDEWVQEFSGSTACIAPVNSIDEAFKDPHLAQRGMVTSVDHPGLGKVASIAAPFHFSETPCTYRSGAPELGEHTVEVLRELGMSSQEIKTLQSNSII